MADGGNHRKVDGRGSRNNQVTSNLTLVAHILKLAATIWLPNAAIAPCGGCSMESATHLQDLLAVGMETHCDMVNWSDSTLNGSTLFIVHGSTLLLLPSFCYIQILLGLIGWSICNAQPDTTHPC